MCNVSMWRFCDTKKTENKVLINQSFKKETKSKQIIYKLKTKRSLKKSKEKIQHFQKYQQLKNYKNIKNSNISKTSKLKKFKKL